MKKKFEKFLTVNGYKKVGYGYKKINKKDGTVHWVTLFDEVGTDKLQVEFYSYLNNENDLNEYNYTTGILKLTMPELILLSKIFEDDRL